MFLTVSKRKIHLLLLWRSVLKLACLLANGFLVEMSWIHVLDYKSLAWENKGEFLHKNPVSCCYPETSSPLSYGCGKSETNSDTLVHIACSCLLPHCHWVPLDATAETTGLLSIHVRPEGYQECRGTIGKHGNGKRAALKWPHLVLAHRHGPRKAAALTWRQWGPEVHWVVRSSCQGNLGCCSIWHWARGPWIPPV